MILDEKNRKSKKISRNNKIEKIYIEKKIPAQKHDSRIGEHGGEGLENIFVNRKKTKDFEKIKKKKRIVFACKSKL